MSTAASLLPYIASSLIAAAVVVVGWFVNSYLNRKTARRLYRERRNDMQKAIYAEISAFVELQTRNNLEAFGEEVAARIEKDDFRPFLVKEDHSSVYRALMRDIHYLPFETIDIVTRFYQRLSMISAIKDAMMSDGFESLNKSRRALTYRHYIATSLYALDEGREALVLIEKYSSGGSQAVREYKNALQNAKANEDKWEVKAWIENEKKKR